MSRRTTSARATSVPVTPAHERQLRRLESLTHPSSLPDVPFVDVKTQRRSEKILMMLWQDAPSGLTEVLDQTSITVIGGGDVQLDWEIGGRYFEVEIPAEGPLPYIFEKDGQEGEASFPSPSRLVETFRSFWLS